MQERYVKEVELLIANLNKLSQKHLRELSALSVELLAKQESWKPVGPRERITREFKWEEDFGGPDESCF